MSWSTPLKASFGSGVAISALLIARGGVAPHPTHSAAQDTTVTAAMLALGDSVFHGRVGGGLCYVCHGGTAKGAKGIAPDLTDGKWLHGDGSLQFLQSVVEKGVPKPKENVPPMPPRGGSNLSPAQVRAVAAYVWSLNKK